MVQSSHSMPMLRVGHRSGSMGMTSGLLPEATGPHVHGPHNSTAEAPRRGRFFLFQKPSKERTDGRCLAFQHQRKARSPRFPNYEEICASSVLWQYRNLKLRCRGWELPSMERDSMTPKLLCCLMS